MWHTLRSAFQYLKLRPYELDTPEGRSRERYRLAAWNGLANLASSIIGMASVFLIIKLALPSLGAERFGIWMAISSLATILSFMDLGVGNGLVNLVAAAQANPDHTGRLKEVVARGMMLLIAIGTIVGLIAFGLIYILPTEKLIKVSSEAMRAETKNTMQMFAAIFGLSIPLYGLQRIFFGLQKAWLTHSVKVASYLISSVAVYLLVQHQVSLPVLLVATYGVQTIAPIALLPLLLRTLRSAPQHSQIHLTPIQADIKSLLSISGLFFVLQIGGVIGWGSDTLIAASLLGASSVVPLSIAQRLFQFVTIPLSIVNGPLWAAYADAHARNDTLFIKRTLARSLKFTALFAIAVSTLLLLTSDWLVALWLGSESYVVRPLIVAFAAWSIIDAVGNCFAMYLNGCGIVKVQLVVVVLFCILAIPLKYFLPLQFGITGIIVATITAYLLCVVLPYTTLFKKDVLAGLSARS